MTAPTHSVGTRSELMNRLTRTPRGRKMVGVQGALGETLSTKMKFLTPRGTPGRSREIGHRVHRRGRLPRFTKIGKKPRTSPRTAGRSLQRSNNSSAMGDAGAPAITIMLPKSWRSQLMTQNAEPLPFSGAQGESGSQRAGSQRWGNRCCGQRVLSRQQ